MGNLKNASNVILSDKIIDVVINNELSETTERLLNGAYVVQTVGSPAEVVTVDCLITYDNLQLLKAAAVDKSPVTATIWNTPISGTIIGQIKDYTRRRGGANPLYELKFEMAVQNNVSC